MGVPGRIRKCWGLRILYEKLGLCTGYPVPLTGIRAGTWGSGFEAPGMETNIKTTESWGITWRFGRL